MTEFDAATAAVEAALAAGARYADARVMHRRYESMTARNGDVEELSQDEDAGIGVRALVGSSWGFFAVPDLSDAAARAAGGRATAIAAASAAGARRRRSTWCPVAAVSAVLGQRLRGRPARRAAVRQGRPAGAARPRTMPRAGADLAEGLYQIWDTRKWFVSSEGHRIDQHIRECGGRHHRPRRSATARPSAAPTRLPRPVRHPRLGAGRRARPDRARRADRRRGAGAADRAAVPGRRDRR